MAITIAVSLPNTTILKLWLDFFNTLKGKPYD